MSFMGVFSVYEVMACSLIKPDWVQCFQIYFSSLFKKIFIIARKVPVHRMEATKISYHNLRFFVGLFVLCYIQTFGPTGLKKKKMGRKGKSVFT